MDFLCKMCGGTISPEDNSFTGILSKLSRTARGIEQPGAAHSDSESEYT